MSIVYKMIVVVTRSPFEAAGSEVDISETTLAEMISSKLYHRQETRSKCLSKNSMKWRNRENNGVYIVYLFVNPSASWNLICMKHSRNFTHHTYICTWTFNIILKFWLRKKYSVTQKTTCYCDFKMKVNEYKQSNQI